MDNSKDMCTRPTEDLNDEWQPRSQVERRCRKDKRSRDAGAYLKNGGAERRRSKERRKMEERRDKWLRIGNWCSVSVFDED